jgi:hypothetical protein
MPQAIHRQLDRCDICGKKIHRKDLVRTQARYNRPQGNNYFQYSSYDGTFWAIAANCTAHSEDMGFGPDAEDCRAKISSSNTLTEIKGAKTFLLTTSGEPAIIYTTESTDISAFTSFVFGIYVGQYHANEDPAVLTVEIGNCTSGASTLYELLETTTRSGKHVWTSVNIADLDSNVDTSATYWYVRASATSSENFYFWIDWMQLEKDASRPGAFISTNGAAIDYTTDSKRLTTVKVCNRCKEQLTRESQKRGRPRVEVESDIDNEFQEV